jgi:large subunit ribosomal protein L9
MANSQVLLLKPIEGLGAEGDMVTVRAGYARNYLLPRNQALPITQANKKYVESLLKARETREQREIETARELGEKIEKSNLAIAVKTGEGGKMFGAVTAGELIKRLQEEGIELTKKQLALPQPIKELGSHLAHVKLHADLQVDLKFEVVSENPIEEVASKTTSDESQD